MVGVDRNSKDDGGRREDLSLTYFPSFHFLFDGEYSQHMNTRVASEPIYALRKRNHSQLQQHTILFLTHKFEKLTIHEVSEEDLSKSLKDSVDPKGIIFPPLLFLD